MTVKARLYYAEGYRVGIGQVYGQPQYGLIGFGVESTPGYPLFSAVELIEIENQVDAVVGGTWGTPQYGSFIVRQAALPAPVTTFSVRAEGAFSPEFVEVADVEPELRVLEDELQAYEFDETLWPA